MDIASRRGTGGATESAAAGGDPALGRVVVVGAGVSGCACAAYLATQAVEVTLVSSALDVVGIPGYGPEIWAGAGGWGEVSHVFSQLPLELRWAWLNTASVPGTGDPLVIVDRRAVSIESKLVLDRSPWILFRQGLVEELRWSGPSARPSAEASARGAEREAGAENRDHAESSDCPACSDGPDHVDGLVEVETAFGEVFRADYVVLAPGLALKGRSQVGVEEMLGGRRGEVPADRLCDGLEAMGAELEKVSLKVGPRYAGHSDVLRCENGQGMHMRKVPQIPVRLLLGSKAVHEDVSAKRGAGPAWDHPMLQKPFAALARALGLGGSDDAGALAAGLAESAWPADHPPAPHYPEELRPGIMMIEAGGVADSEDPQDPGKEGCPPRFVALDGAATSEYYLSPETILWSTAEPPWQGLVRPGYSVTAQVVRGVSEVGAVAPLGPAGAEGRIRVIGRAAGAHTYLESLKTAVAAADDLVRLLKARGRR